MSTPESELGGAIPGIKFGIGINDLTNQLEYMADPDKGFSMERDNMATVITITKEVTSWRSRHYAIRAGWARDQVEAQHIGVKHTPGVQLSADSLTKILTGVALTKARDQLLLRNDNIETDECFIIKLNSIHLHPN